MENRVSLSHGRVASDDYTVTIKSNSAIKNNNNAITYLESNCCDEIELFLVRQGHVIVILDGTPHYMTSNHLMCIMPRTIHSVHSTSSNPFFFTSCKFNPSLFKDVYSYKFNMSYSNIIENKNLTLEYVIRDDSDVGSKVIEIFNSLILLCKKQSLGYELGVNGFLEILMSYIINMAAESSLGFSEEDLQNEVILALEYIDSNYMNDIILYELANIANMSKYQFIRNFHKAMNKTPVEYINCVRINKACEMLRQEGNCKIVTIANNVGYKDLSYFNRVFKKAIGITPTLFRKQQQLQVFLNDSVNDSESMSSIPFYSFMI